MRDERSGNAIVFNGEIYNHHRLRRELSERGRSWRGTSDTETLLAAFDVWGLAMLDRLKGMFAFVLFERLSCRLIVVRDRLGIKPLYYRSDATGYAFSSEIRPLVRGRGPQPTEETISAYLKWGASPESMPIFSETQMLPAGHWMEIDAGGRSKTQRYWPRAAFPVASGRSPAHHVRQLIQTAVEEHLLSDVPVASFLSGGLDSSIITGLAAERLPGKLETFSVSFRDARYDESQIASDVAKRFGTKHLRVELKETEVLGLVREAIDRYDTPSVDAINSYIVCSQAAARGIKVALSGLGGDELFGGYPSFKDVRRLRILAALPHALRRMLPLPRGWCGRIADLPAGDAVALAYWRRKFWSNAELGMGAERAAESYPEPPFPLADDFARVSWAELTGYMRHMLLRDSDQMSMAVSLEVRVPFLDHELVEYVLALPSAVKTQFRGPKGLLIEAFRGWLPPYVYERPKQGFELPMKEWMKGALSEYVEEGLRKVATYLPEPFLRRCSSGFGNGTLHWTRLWSVVVLGHYLAKNAAPLRG